jgi:hypothetical protein
VRQLFSLRFVAAVAALAGLAFLVNVVVADEDDAIDAVLEVEIVARQMDLTEPIFAMTTSDDFEVARDGTTVGFIDVIMSGNRVMRVAPGTPGEITCEELEEINRCAVFADLLGDAVVWFAILPQAPRATVELPPIVDLEDGYALFENGWQILYADIIERDCGNIDIPTFSDFLRRFGPDSVTVVDLEQEQVVRVRCGEEVVTSTSVPATSVPVTSIDGAFPDRPPVAPTSAP